MIRSILDALRSLKFLKKDEPAAEQIEPHGHHWQGNLDQLATRMGESPVQMRSTTEIAFQRNEEAKEVEDNFKKLFDEFKNDSKPKEDPLRASRKPRSTDDTAVDLKAWWGQSVATWDPIDSKNVHSPRDQKLRRRTKWFE
ncbi:MAG: hypothetical protein AB7W16_03775 [Candidatus Obscuribacterales bacterium]